MGIIAFALSVGNTLANIYLQSVYTSVGQNTMEMNEFVATFTVASCSWGSSPEIFSQDEKLFCMKVFRTQSFSL